MVGFKEREVLIHSNIFLSHHFFSSVMSKSLWPHRLQHRLPCPLPTPRAYSNSCPSNWSSHPTISSSVVPFSSNLQSFPASGSFPVTWFFVSGGQILGASASASVLPMNIQGWFPLGLTSLILLSKGLSGVFSSTTICKHPFFCIQPSLWSNPQGMSGKSISGISSFKHLPTTLISSCCFLPSIFSANSTESSIYDYNPLLFTLHFPLWLSHF